MSKKTWPSDTHVAEPDTANKSWCGADVTATKVGTIDCLECIALLVSHPGYYNQLRAKGLRTKSEREWEEKH